MKPFVRLVAAAATAVVLSAPAHAELNNLTIGMNPSGSAVLLLGGTLAKPFQEELGIRATARPQEGTSVFLSMVGTGEMISSDRHRLMLAGNAQGVYLK